MNIVGLSTGLACIMVLAVVSYQFLGADANMREIDQMYYLKTKAPDGSEFSMTTYPLLGEIVKKCPEVEAASHIQQWYYPWLKYGNKEFQETTTFVDTGYFDVFVSPLNTAIHLLRCVINFLLYCLKRLRKNFSATEIP